jgi:hypothetical protein
MIFDPTQDMIMPEMTDPSKAPTLVDMSVLKKAGIYSTRHHNNSTVQGRASVPGGMQHSGSNERSNSNKR